MIPNPIHKVLSTLFSHEVKHLLMGGQACVFYGAAEFSRDCDVAVLAEGENFARLEAALTQLRAECIAVPPSQWHYLDRGHAIHFRCNHPQAKGIRLDIMSKMRGCDPFEALWKRRTTIEGGEQRFELLGIEDLVRAKKTQRDKDWPMIRRLIDAHYDQTKDAPTDDRVRFWLRESRTAEVIIHVGAEFPELLREVMQTRPLLVEALPASRTALAQALDKERLEEMEKDKQYWAPLKKELEDLRRVKRRSRQEP